MKPIISIGSAIALAAFAGSIAQAQTAGNLLGGPVAGAGNAVSGVAAAHAGIAPTVNRASPTLEPLTDGVTNAIGAVGAGTTGTGQSAQANGVIVGARDNGGRPVASVGARSTGNQGSLVAVGNGRQ